ncbi:flagellar protein FlgN [Aquincola tertiaricarbonis]|uniref:Flagellar protein FlgN n=1 Tax=Aquincola tertiaricarbonis TaxID=391953 RepID=A0ABY4S2Q6_AQUTE|nr:flagellar export chaperone FlgN [Aquincola tertiaricarbonis]URI06257.1 flagellar protein FlgN [Aquincola tertiaricarbonis]
MTKRSDVLRGLVSGVHADHADYQTLRGLLGEQFQAALRHDTAALTQLGERISALVAVLDGRRRDRMRGVALLGIRPPATMAQVIALFAPAMRAPLQQLWQGLEALVVECKRLNSRNCRLLMEQHALMQRVLAGEADTYVPA